MRYSLELVMFPPALLDVEQRSISFFEPDWNLFGMKADEKDMLMPICAICPSMQGESNEEVITANDFCSPGPISADAFAAPPIAQKPDDPSTEMLLIVSGSGSLFCNTST